jgi:hypothetical protein
VYLTLDLKRAHLQALLYFNAISKKNIEDIKNKYTFGNALLNEKFIYGYAYKKTPLNNLGYILDKRLIDIALKCDDPLITLINENCEKIGVIGDRLFLKIKQNENVFEPYLYDEYKTTNGIHFFVDKCEKITLKSNCFPDIYIDNSKASNKKFYSNLLYNTISYDLYPQIYKKIIGEKTNSLDFVYGYDNDINFFNKKIWEA